MGEASGADRCSARAARTHWLGIGGDDLFDVNSIGDRGRGALDDRRRVDRPRLGQRRYAAQQRRSEKKRIIFLRNDTRNWTQLDLSGAAQVAKATLISLLSPSDARVHGLMRTSELGH